MSSQTLSPVFDKLTDTVKDRAAGYAHRAVQEPPIRGSPLPPPPPPSPPLPYPPPLSPSPTPPWPPFPPADDFEPMPDSWNLRKPLVCNDTSWEPVRHVTGTNTFQCPWTFSAVVFRDCVQRHGSSATVDFSGYDYSVAVTGSGPEKVGGRTVYDCNDNREPIFDFGDNGADGNILLDLRGGLSYSTWLPGSTVASSYRLDPVTGRDQEYRFRVAKEGQVLLPHRKWTQVQLTQEDGGGEGAARVHAYVDGVEVASAVMPCPRSGFRRHMYMCRSTWGAWRVPNFNGQLRDVYWYPYAMRKEQLDELRLQQYAPPDYMFQLHPSWLSGPQTLKTKTAGRNIYVWGKGTDGQLGLGGYRARCAPPNSEAARSPRPNLQSGPTHSPCAESALAHPCCWHPPSSWRRPGNKVPSPRLLDGLKNEEVVDFGCGGKHMVALVQRDNAVFTWGQNSRGQLGLGDKVWAGSVPLGGVPPAPCECFAPFPRQVDQLRPARVMMLRQSNQTEQDAHGTFPYYDTYAGRTPKESLTKKPSPK